MRLISLAVLALSIFSSAANAANPYCESADAQSSGVGFCKPKIDIEGEIPWGTKENYNWDMTDSAITNLAISSASIYSALNSTAGALTSEISRATARENAIAVSTGTLATSKASTGTCTGVYFPQGLGSGAPTCVQPSNVTGSAASITGNLSTAQVNLSTVTDAVNSISTANFPAGFNGASQLVQLDSTGKFTSIDGSFLTNIKAINASPISYWYSMNTASDISGYGTLKPAPTSLSESSAPVVVSANNTDFLIRSFASPLGSPGVTTIPTGSAERHLWLNSTGNSSFVRADIYIRHAAGGEVLMWTSTSSVLTNGTITLYELPITIPVSTVIQTTDRWVSKFYARKTSGGSATVTLYSEGSSHASYMETTIPGNALTSTALDFPVVNGEAFTIFKGRPVYDCGSSIGLIKICRADNTDTTKSRVLGVLTDNCLASAACNIRRYGTLNTVNTSVTGSTVNALGQTWAAGDLLFLTTSGGLTNVRPTSGRSVKVGYSIFGSVAGGANDALFLVPLENPVWATAASGESVVLRAGDIGGATGVQIRDYNNIGVATITSNGGMTLKYGLSAATATIDDTITANYYRTTSTGTAAVPAIRGPNSNSSGVLWDEYGEVLLSVNGVVQGGAGTQGICSTTLGTGSGCLTGLSGSNAAPQHTFKNDSNTGLASPVADQLNAVAGGVAIASMSTTGMVVNSGTLNASTFSSVVTDYAIAASSLSVANNLLVNGNVRLAGAPIGNYSVSIGSYTPLTAPHFAPLFVSTWGTQSDTVIARFMKSYNYGSSRIMIGTGDSFTRSISFEHNSGNTGGFRYGTYMDANVINEEPAGEGGSGSLNMVTAGQVQARFGGTGLSGHNIIGGLGLAPRANLEVVSSTGPTQYALVVSSQSRTPLFGVKGDGEAVLASTLTVPGIIWADGSTSTTGRISGGSGTGGHTISTGILNGPWVVQLTRAGMNFDSNYFVITDSAAGNGTHISLSTQASTVHSSSRSLNTANITGGSSGTGVCVSTPIAAFLTNAGSMEVSFEGSIAQDGSGNITYLSFLVDGAFTSGHSATLPMMIAREPGGSSVAYFPAHITDIVPVSAGTHSVCVVFNRGSGGGTATLHCGDSPCRTIAKEVR